MCCVLKAVLKQDLMGHRGAIPGACPRAAALSLLLEPFWTLCVPSQHSLCQIWETPCLSVGIFPGLECSG